MRAKLKYTILFLFWLVIAALIVLAFAGITNPNTIDTDRTKIELHDNVIGITNEALDIIVEVNQPIDNLHASMSLDTSNRHAITSDLKLPGNLENIQIDHDRELAFLANSFSGLQIVDIKNPADLHIIGSLQTPGKAWELKVLGDILYLASASGGLHMIDISTVETPTIISSLKLEGYSILGLAVAKNTVYAISGNKGLMVIDVTNIKAPRLINKLYTDEGAWGLALDKERLYVSCGKFKLETYDISTPENPRKTGQTSLPDRAWNMSVHNNVLYMPTINSGLLVVDVNQPDAPELLQTNLELAGHDHIDLQHDRAYITSRFGNLSILDIASPTDPKLLGTFDLPARPRDIAVSGRTSFIAGGIKGLQAFNTDELVSADPVVNLQIPGNLKKVLVDDNFFYIASSKHGLYVSAINSDGEPGEIIAHLQINDMIKNMVRICNHLYLTGSRTGLYIIDISEPSAPILVGEQLFTKRIKDITAIGKYIFLIDALKGVLVIDVESPKSPELIGQFPLQKPRRAAVDEAYLYVATAKSFYVLDYSTPQALVQVGKLEFPWPLQKFTDVKQIAVSDSFAYLAAGPAGLFSIDLSQPESPQLEEVTTLDGDILTVKIEANTVFAITRQGKLWLLSRDSDRRTIRRAVIDSLGIAYDLIPYDNRVVIANGIKGLTLLPLPQPLEVHSRMRNSGRVDNSEIITLRIPPQSRPGIYNLNLLNQGELTEFIGAVQLKKTEE